jgi:excisionase family DNA binding protein
MADLTPEQVAEELQMHIETVRRLLREGVLPGYQPGKRGWRITRESLDAFKAEGGAKAVGRPKKEGE